MIRLHLNENTSGPSPAALEAVRNLTALDLAFYADDGRIREVCERHLGVSPGWVAVTNGLDEGYIRPIAYIGDGVMGVFPADNPIRLMIAVWKWGAYLGEEALKKGIRVKVSSYTRYQPNSVMTRAKVTGNYVTGVLAKKEARARRDCR